jgi:hypothetical protein
VQDLWEWSFDEGRSTPKWEFGLVLVSDGRWVLLDFPVSKMPKVTQPKKAKKQAGRGSRKKRR